MNNLDPNGAGMESYTPVPITNPPGLPAITYRAGTYEQFKRTMLARLGDINLPALQALTTRKDDDFSIALLDAWAMVADVLTFYQERIANESFKGTATEPQSLNELARTVNYKLRPGIASSVYLAFILDDSPNAPGQATIDAGTKVQSIPQQGELPQVFETGEKIEARAKWNTIRPVATMQQRIYEGISTLVLQGTAANLQVGDALLIIGQVGDEARRMFRFIQGTKLDTAAQQTTVTLLSAGEPEPGSLYSNPHVFALRTRASLFGQNAPDWRLLPDSTHQAYNRSANRNTRGSYPDWPFMSSTTSLDLDMVYPKLVPNSWCVVAWPSPTASQRGPITIAPIASVSEVSLVGYALSTRVTRLTLETPQKAAPASMDDIRRTVVYAQSEELLLAIVPSTDPVTGDSIRVYGNNDDYAQLQRHTIAVTGERFDARGTQEAEIIIVSGTTPDLEQGVVRLQLESPLANNYYPDTLTINGNIVLATQGETVQDEILGSGDTSQPYQHFTLRQFPLIYTAEPNRPLQTGPGPYTTLDVRVDGISWQEVSTLNGHGGDERVFVTSTDEAGKVTVQFGEGYNAGSRLPTGDNNVHATYRKGTAQPTPIRPGQLSLLMTRPLGVKGVTNPLGDSGGVAPETAEDARRNADNSVLTLGRIVSLEDYENFARSYTEVAKARATVFWNQQRKCVVVTIAGPDTPDKPQGTPIEPGGPIYGKINNGMGQASDPSIPFVLQTYTPVSFRVAAQVKLDPDAPIDEVQKQAEQALRKYFSFDVRNFGQHVTVREVMAVIQSVPGVAAVRVSNLSRVPPAIGTDIEGKLNSALPALMQDGNISRAELLLVDSAQPFANNKLEEIHEF